MIKAVTFVIAAYNAEKYLNKCLSSFLCQKILDQIEVLIVNDGSTDQTAQIAHQFCQKYPHVFRLISQENKGHGGALNTAFAQAKGQYLRPVDADDWVITENLPRYVQTLASAKVDAVITSYHTVDMISGKKREFSCNCEAAEREISLPELLQVYDTIAPCCSFHGITYRTSTYQDSGLQLSEHIFYEDQEYAALPFFQVKSILILPLFLYQYQIGNSEQSVAFVNQVKRISHIEQVVLRMIHYKQGIPSPSAGSLEYYFQKLATVVVSYHATALLKNPDKQEGRLQSACFFMKVEQQEPKVNQLISRKLKTLRLFNRLHLSPVLYQRLLESQLYKQVRDWWRK